MRGSAGHTALKSRRGGARRLGRDNLTQRSGTKIGEGRSHCGAGLAPSQNDTKYETGHTYLIIIIVKISQCLPRLIAVVILIRKSS